MRTIQTIYGDTLITDRRSAGMNAQESGALFENQVLDELKKFEVLGFHIYEKPTFTCHWNLSRQGDFEIISGERVIHIECKQLGDAQSHFDKLSHCLMNLIHGSYGKEFWLVYDYNKEGARGTIEKIHKLKLRCESIKKQVALQGITFELILLDDIAEHLKKLQS